MGALQALLGGRTLRPRATAKRLPDPDRCAPFAAQHARREGPISPAGATGAARAELLPAHPQVNLSAAKTTTGDLCRRLLADADLANIRVT